MCIFYPMPCFSAKAESKQKKKKLKYKQYKLKLINKQPKLPKKLIMSKMITIQSDTKYFG